MRKFDMPERIRPIEQMLELNEDAISPEHLDSQVQKAQEQLLQLKRQQEQIEKQKRELEELSRRQEELERGRAEMSDKLTRSLVVLEREAYDTQKKLEQIRATRESFGQHLELIEAIDPKSWNPADLHKELSRALSAVDDARTEFSQQRSRLQAADDAHGDVALPEAAPDVADLLEGGRSFRQWLKIGFAFSLPLMIFGVLALLIFFWMAGRAQ
jgi:chromosome segregation ATPase